VIKISKNNLGVLWNAIKLKIILIKRKVNIFEFRKKKEYNFF